MFVSDPYMPIPHKRLITNHNYKSNTSFKLTIQWLAGGPFSKKNFKLHISTFSEIWNIKFSYCVIRRFYLYSTNCPGVRNCRMSYWIDFNKITVAVIWYELGYYCNICLSKRKKTKVRHSFLGGFSAVKSYQCSSLHKLAGIFSCLFLVNGLSMLITQQ